MSCNPICCYTYFHMISPQDVPESVETDALMDEDIKIEKFCPAHHDDERGFTPFTTGKVENDSDLRELIAALSSNPIREMLDKRPELLSQAQTSLRIQALDGMLFLVLFLGGVFV